MDYCTLSGTEVTWKILFGLGLGSGILCFQLHNKSFTGFPPSVGLNLLPLLGLVIVTGFKTRAGHG
jgi:hypothetical protein